MATGMHRAQTTTRCNRTLVCGRGLRSGPWEQVNELRLSRIPGFDTGLNGGWMGLKSSLLQRRIRI